MSLPVTALPAGAYAEVIGDPIGHSKSPVIHGYWLLSLGLAADYRRAHVKADALPAYFAERRNDPAWRGCNVTVPHKSAVLPLIDRMEPIAARLGAVNTGFRAPDGALVGTNTDAAGFLEPLRPLLARSHLFRMARLIGTGGAAAAIAHALADEGFAVVVIGRDEGKAQALADALPGEHYAAPLADFAVPTDFAFDDRAGCLDLVVNATTLGMSGQPPLQLDLSHVPPGSIIYDIVYAPLETPLLARARVAGLRTIDGLHMLVGQAALAFERFFGQPPPRDRLHDAELRTRLVA